MVLLVCVFSIRYHVHFSPFKLVLGWLSHWLVHQKNCLTVANVVKMTFATLSSVQNLNTLPSTFGVAILLTLTQLIQVPRC